MARSIEEIQNEIIKEKEKHSALNDLTSTSKTAVWRLWVYIVANCIRFHEKIVEKNAQNSRPHTIRWYREQALAFQDGHNLVWKNGQFNYASSQATAKIIKQCAVIENTTGSLEIKVAGQNGSNPAPINDLQLSRFKSYINQIKDAGNKIEVVNRPADLLDISLEVYVDEQLYYLADGALIRDANQKPVEKSAYDFLKKLEFNGAFVRTFFKDHLQQVEGVKLPVIKSIKWKYGDFAYKETEEWQLPDAGYFKIENLNITYKKYAI